MPLAIEYVSGIIIIVIKQGMASERSFRGRSLTPMNIIMPTIIRTGAVAAAGIARNIGEKNKAAVKHKAMLRAVRPERPPCATPEELSIKVHAADVPSTDEHSVPIESAMNILFIPGTEPSLSANPPLMQTPRAEPVRLKRSMNRNERTTTNMSVVSILSH